MSFDDFDDTTDDSYPQPVPVQAPAPQAALPVWFIVGIVVVIVVGMGTSYVLFGQ